MNKHNIKETSGWFSLLQTNDQSQTAIMTLAPGKWSGKKGNEHPGSDQVLLVLEGEVVAEIGDERAVLRAGDIVTVEAGAPHRFGNESQSKALTFNVYAPPAY